MNSINRKNEHARRVAYVPGQIWSRSFEPFVITPS